MAKAKKYNITGEHVVDESIKHLILEKVSMLHKHSTIIEPKPKKKSSGFLFNLFIYTIIRYRTLVDLS